jgi:hypothetical protein
MKDLLGSDGQASVACLPCYTPLMTLISPHIESILRSTILPELEKGRKDFDRPHTEAVVHWTKEILLDEKNPDLDPQVLITAAYAHDWGYIGLFEGANSHDRKEIAKRKPLHMERGAKFITGLIEEKLSSDFSGDQKHAVAHLVFMHDKVEDLTTESELLLMEADTIGMLDTARVKPTFSKADNEVFLTNEIYQRRLPRFIHPLAKTVGAQLAQERERYYD